MKTLIINNKTFYADDTSINDGLYIPCATKEEFIDIWENFTPQSIAEFSYDNQVFYGSKMRETSFFYNEDGSFVGRFSIELKTQQDILQESIESLAQAAMGSDAIEEWKVDTAYVVGTILSYKGSVYRAAQSHTSQSDWLPPNVPALYTRLYDGGSSESEIPEWTQPDATNPYMKGDKVMFEGKVYESLIDNNVWSPTAYPAGWKLIEE